MKDDHPVRSKLVYRVLRVLAGVMTLIFSVLISYACIGALFGDQEMLIDFIDEDNASLTLNIPTILAIVATNILGVASLALLFFSINRFLKHAERGELLITSARNALRRLGVAMIMFYLTTRLLAMLVPALGIPGFVTEYSVMLPIFFIDMDFLFLLIGVVLLTVARALGEGQAAQEEAKQYV